MKILIVVLYILFLAGNLWIFLIRPPRPWQEKLGLLLQIVGLYSIAFGFLAQTQILETFKWLAEDMTSPNLFQFLRGNFVFLSALFSAVGVAMEPVKEAYGVLYLFEMAALILLWILAFIYSVFHLLVIVPLTYFGYVIVSVPIDAIVRSTIDAAISVGEQTIKIKEVVTNNSVSLKNFLIGIPSALLAVLLKVTILFKRSTTALE